MKNIEAYSRIPWLLVVISLCFASNVQSQDLFREMDQVKSELSELKNELNDLRNLVFSLRKALLESTTAPDRQKTEKTAPKEEKAVKQKPPVDEQQLTKTICQAVGKFFSEAEAVLRMSDTSAADQGMKAAVQKLTSALQGYAETHRVSKLMNIYEGLAWDAYTAVEMRGSIIGNEDFLRVLAKHKQKYLETCPRY